MTTVIILEGSHGNRSEWPWNIWKLFDKFKYTFDKENPTLAISDEWLTIG